MKRLDNAAVVKSFLDHEAAESHTGNLWTDGRRLMSYRTCIAEFDITNTSQVKYLYINRNRYSMTTSAKHQSPLRHALNRLAASSHGSRYSEYDFDIVEIVDVLQDVRIGTQSIVNLVKHGTGSYWK